VGGWRVMAAECGVGPFGPRSGTSRRRRRARLERSPHNAYFDARRAAHEARCEVSVRRDAEGRLADGVYEFTLSKQGTIVAADRCHEESSKAVLDSFAVQLAGGETPER